MQSGRGTMVFSEVVLVFCREYTYFLLHNGGKTIAIALDDFAMKIAALTLSLQKLSTHSQGLATGIN